MAEPTLLLLDNGSLNPAATQSLRSIAASLSQRLDAPVEPVSLLHSSAISADRLEGRPALILEPYLDRAAEAGRRRFLVVPLFIGPSGALVDYLPGRIASLRERWPDLVVSTAAPLAGEGPAVDARLGTILEDHVRALVGPREPAKVVVVDHGSPKRAVTEVRNFLGAELARRLGPTALVRVASMERRPGPDYAFADPLLEALLDEPGFAAGRVILAMLFISPGRHAGPGGDVAGICAAACERHPGMQATLTKLIGRHPLLIDILADRVRAARAGRLT